MTGAALALTAPTAGTQGTNASTAPVVAGKANIIGGGGINAANAAAGTGAGVWNLAQGADQLTLTIPADATAASYTTTITTTLNAAV
ncbi:MAG TPA: WxL domain-containing protein [Baekduia sp.]|nr:WxL domain-containing protein [Baekduia sp.]